MNKKEVQQKILKDGKPLNLKLFVWDKTTNTFSSNEDDLVIDLSYIDSVTITAGSYATITAGSYATITARSYATITARSSATITARYSATITAGSYATITAGYSATITARYYATITAGYYATITAGSSATITAEEESVIVNRNVFEVIQTENKVKICPYDIAGHLQLIDDKWYLNGDKKLGKHIIQDNILSKVIRKRGNVYKVLNNGETKESYLVTDGENWSHGITIKEAKESLIYKISNRDKSQYKDMKLSTTYSFEEAVKMYRVITGACEGGVRGFLDKIKTKDKYSVKEIISLTKGQYGNESLSNFIK